MIITVLLGLVMLAMTIIMLTGRGAFLIAGYNTMPKSQREKYDTKRMCKFTGKILLPISILTILIGFERFGGAGWFVWVYFGTVFGLVAFAIIYSNTGNRFNK